MDRRTDRAQPRPGDRVIFVRGSDVYEVILIATSGEEQTLKTCSTLELAYETAQGGLGGGRLWWRHYQAPDVTEPYKIHHNLLI
jgi:hypothetical protein